MFSAISIFFAPGLKDRLFGVLLAVGFLYASDLAAQEKIRIDLRDAEIASLAEIVADFTGRTITLDPGLGGSVTIISSDEMDIDTAWELFQSVLRGRGFVAVQSGAIWEVVPETSSLARGQLSPGTDAPSAQKPGGQDIVTRLVDLSRVPSQEAVRILRPLVDEAGYIEALQVPNTLIISDTRNNVDRLTEVARALDRDAREQTEVIAFSFASAAEVATAVRAAFGLGETGSPVRMSVEAGSNRLIVSGAAVEVERVRKIASELDVAPTQSPQDRRVTRVLRLNHAEAETVAVAVQSLLGIREGSGAVLPDTVFGDGLLTAAAGPRAEGLSFGNLSTPELAGVDLGTDAANRALQAAQDPQAALGGASIGLQPGSGSFGGTPTLRFGTQSSPQIAVQPARDGNALIVRGQIRLVDEVLQIVQQLDVPRAQVMIEAAIVEVSGDVADRLGVQLGLDAAAAGSGFAATSLSAGGVPIQGLLTSLGSNPLSPALASGLAANFTSGNFNILVQALSQTTGANLLSTPSITTLDNSPATIVVGQNVPFRTGNFTVDGSAVVPFETIERRDVGITMVVLPRIGSNGSVRLEIAQEVSSIAPATTGAADIVTNRRVINTTVEATDRGTVVLGGLITDDRQTVDNSVPGLSKIPVVGGLFRARGRDFSRRTLFVFLRPTIINGSGAAARVAQGQLNRVTSAQSAPPPPDILKPLPLDKLPLEIEGLY